jgi:HEAT repeats
MNFIRAIQYSAACLFLALFSTPTLHARVDLTNQDVPVDIRLRPDKKTIMLGEPLFVAFEVTNLSGEKLYLAVGGDYRNRFGRPESFRVTIKADDGAELPQLESFNTGGFIGSQPIEPGATYTVRLFVPHWANIERTGSYRVNVRRNMALSAYDISDSRKPKYSMKADVDAEFTVVPAEENRMGGIIASLGSVMLDSSDPKAVESARALASIQDKRVITYFAGAVREFGDVEFVTSRNGEYIIKSIAIWALGTYDDDRAIDALQALMNSPTDDTRLDVATVFGESPHKSAIKLLLEMQDDNYGFVRLRVAQGLAKVKTKESLTVLHKLLKDENEDVRKAAEKSLKQTEQ